MRRLCISLLFVAGSFLYFLGHVYALAYRSIPVSVTSGVVHPDGFPSGWSYVTDFVCDLGPGKIFRKTIYAKHYGWSDRGVMEERLNGRLIHYFEILSDIPDNGGTPHLGIDSELDPHSGLWVQWISRVPKMIVEKTKSPLRFYHMTDEELESCANSKKFIYEH